MAVRDTQIDPERCEKTKISAAPSAGPGQPALQPARAPPALGPPRSP